ncbi:shikimate kinase [Jatrophihabitans sp.]|uniref:shikimate kinase n=1 Tax=Jatrophihabitans sp. TaxID=1932789 RepID=UPI002C45C6CA|nr:shikimate kinase [Jatrophihabitans sp.]
MPPRVVLVGLPGTGKSSVGAELARRLGVPFADTDELVTRQTGRSVAEIFERQGEAAFRELEADLIAEALAGFGGVLALGGGAVTTGAVRADLAASGVPVVLLTAGQDELLNRLAPAEPRPLLAGNASDRLAELAAARGGWYAEVATVSIDTGGRSVTEVADLLHRQLIGQAR